MKYEEWIRYEEKRLNQPDPHAWITLEPALPHAPSPGKSSVFQGDKSPVWTLVVQVFNSRRI